MHGANQVALQPLGFELWCRRDIEQNESSAGDERESAFRVGTGRGRFEGQFEFAGFKWRATGDNDAVVLGPVTVLGRDDDALNILAQARSGGASVDRQSRGDAELGGAVFGPCGVGHGLDVELITQDVGVGVERVGAFGHHNEFREGQPHASARLLAKRERRGDNLADLIHVGNQVIGLREGAGIRPVGEVHRSATGETLPDALCHERQERCRHAGQGFEHREQRVKGIASVGG